MLNGDGAREPPNEVRKLGAFITVSHEVLCDLGIHECDESCPPRYEPPRLPWRRRAYYKLKHAWWKVKRVRGLRVVHRDRVCDSRCGG